MMRRLHDARRRLTRCAARCGAFALAVAAALVQAAFAQEPAYP